MRQRVNQGTGAAVNYSGGKSSGERETGAKKHLFPAEVRGTKQQCIMQMHWLREEQFTLLLVKIKKRYLSLNHASDRMEENLKKLRRDFHTDYLG